PLYCKVSALSIAAREQPLGQGAKWLGARTERVESLQRLRVQLPDFLLGGRDTHDRRVSRFRALGIRPCCLAKRGNISQHVEKVVLNLKCQTDGRGEIGECRLPARLQRRDTRGA